MTEIMTCENFEKWICMSDKAGTVKEWVNKGLIPSIETNGEKMVDVGRLRKELLTVENKTRPTKTIVENVSNT